MGFFQCSRSCQSTPCAARMRSEHNGGRHVIFRHALAAWILMLALTTRLEAQGLHEDFNGSTIDQSVWFEDGSVYLVDGAAYFPPTAPYFPWLLTRVNPFPRTGDFF